jgi:putative DNA primase/helicase
MTKHHHVDVDAELQRIARDRKQREAKREHKGNGQAAADDVRLLFDCASDVHPRPINWLWPSRLALCKLALLAGFPELGKSQIGIDIAARLSTGDAWPDGGYAPMASTIILSAEDAAEDTVRPRLEAAAADLRRVHILRSVYSGDGTRRTFSLQSDLEALGRKIAELGDVALVIVDPITSYMGAKIDSYKTTEVRAVLEPVAEFAQRFNVAMLGISHPPKHAVGKAINAVTGSLAFTAAARLVFLAIEDAEGERNLFLPVKSNIGRKAAGLGYRIAGRLIADDIPASHIVWDNAPVDMTADQALAADAESVKNATALAEAKEFLRDTLADGAKLAADIQQGAATLGIAEKTLRRAGKAIKIKSFKDTFTGPWMWRLPEDGQA